MQVTSLSPKLRREAQGVRLSSSHPSDKAQGVIAGVSPQREENLCLKESRMRSVREKLEPHTTIRSGEGA
jgi:hypothetical protein